METIQIVQEGLVSSLDVPVVVGQQVVAQTVRKAFLTGVEARLAQAENLTKQYKPNTLGRTAIFVA